MPSVLTQQRQELCVNVFFNGELTQSRLIKPTKFASYGRPVGNEKYLNYTGRRIDSNLEIPWVIKPYFQEGSGLAQERESRASFQERWNAVNQLLLIEAAKWGKYGSNKSVMGEYLTELGGTGVPESLKLLEEGKGDRAGFIDVCFSRKRRPLSNHTLHSIRSLSP